MGCMKFAHAVCGCVASRGLGSQGEESFYGPEQPEAEIGSSWEAILFFGTGKLISVEFENGFVKGVCAGFRG